MPLKAILLFLVLVCGACGWSCGPNPPPGPGPGPGPGPSPAVCGDGVCFPGSENCATCAKDCACLGGGDCTRGVCLQPGYHFAGCTAVGRSCTESLCPSCQVWGATSDPALCPDPSFPVPCVCNCSH